MAESCLGNLVKGTIAGAIGGIVGAYVMEQFQGLWNSVAVELKEFQEDEPKKLTSKMSDKEMLTKAAEVEPATVKVAETALRLVGHELTTAEKPMAGEAVHYAMGATSGAIFGAMSELTNAATAGGGALFGASVWLLADEAAVPALGLSQPPSSYPVSTHAYALASHVVYGVTTNFVRGLVR